MQTLQSDGLSNGTLSVTGFKWLEVVYIIVRFWLVSPKFWWTIWTKVLDNSIPRRLKGGQRPTMLLGKLRIVARITQFQ